MKEKIEKFIASRWSIFAIAVVGTLVGLRPMHTCHAQEFVFTTKPTITKPLSFGGFTLNIPFEISHEIRTTYQTDQYRQQQVWQLGNTGLSFSYLKDEPEFVFTCKGYRWTIVSYYAYDILTNGKWHSITCRYDGVTAQFILDKTLIEERMIGTGIAPVTGNLIFSAAPLYVEMPTGRDTVPMDCLAAVIRNVKVSQSYSSIRLNPAPIFALDSNDYAINYNREDNTYTGKPIATPQLRLIPAPVNKGVKNQDKISSAINWSYLAGFMQPNISDAEVKANLIDIGKILCDSFNYAWRIDNLNEFYFYPLAYQPIIDMLKSNPNYVCDVTTVMAQLRPIDGHIPLSESQKNALLPNCDLHVFDNERYCYDAMFGRLALSVPNPRMIVENDEWLNPWADTLVYQNNPACRAAKEASGLTWRQYCGQQFTRVFNYIVTETAKKHFQKAIVVRYDVYFSSNYGRNPLIDYAINCNSDGNATPSQYPTRPPFLKYGGGNQRGEWYFYDLMQYLVRNRIGSEWTNPFIGGGWADDARINLSPAQLSGYTIMLYAGGVDIPLPAYFTLTGSGSTGFQNPQSYLFQATIASYTQAGLSKPDIWDLYQNSTMEWGDQQDQYYRQDGIKAKPNFFFWTGYKNSPAVIRTGTTRTHEHLIFTSVLKPTNTVDPRGQSRQDTVYYHAAPVPFISTIAGRILYWDDRLKTQPDQSLPAANPKVVYYGIKIHPSRINSTSAAVLTSDN